MSQLELTTAPVLNLTPGDLDGILDELRTFHALFSPLFFRPEQRAWAATYLHGLLLDIPRKSIEPMIDPNVHSCGSVPPHGVDELSHPEPGLYIVGMKSYGRAPTFLLLTGYEQVRSVVAALVGDWESARDVQLVLPETGVCSTDRGGGGSCCAPALAVPATGANLIALTPVSA